jgi:hypothetical protein
MADPAVSTPLDSKYIDRLREAFEMARTNSRNLQTIPDPILNGT